MMRFSICLILSLSLFGCGDPEYKESASEYKSSRRREPPIPLAEYNTDKEQLCKSKH